MQNIDITQKVDIDNTYRVSRIMADFDVNLSHLENHIQCEVNFPEKWQIGLICGGSGTGKTTIANELFGGMTKQHDFTAKSVIDDMPAGAPMNEIEKMFYAVGLGSVPSWLKPYRVLSNGEKMRCQLAESLLANDFVVFDEYTSVVDRNVAITLSTALNKCLKHYPEKKFVAVSCHKDIIEYLQPDWILDTDTMQMSFHVAHDLKGDLIYLKSGESCGQSLGSIII